MHATSLAFDVAALLPARRDVAWTVSAASRTGTAPAARLTNGQRHLTVMTDNGHTTLTARLSAHDSAAQLTIAGTAPTTAASAVLRSLLPRLDHHIARRSPAQRHLHHTRCAAEIRTRLGELGVTVQQFDRADRTTGLSWQYGDADVTYTLHRATGTGLVSFRGNLAALETFLTPFLPPHPGPGRAPSRPPRGCGSAARRLVAAFPHAVQADADGLTHFTDSDGGPLQGWITPHKVNAPAGPTTPVTAGICGVGIDLLLSVPAIA
ncbi:hypothetical protein SMD44_p10048 (plasmid) [Streptomyces alboflavus]|uniref:Uncharacterized protein n=1 Tax=Streptomyces alboflavus TaxID=67267 RepID=A0A291W3R4_9ACTN|nr:hypothetical protein [Streptomyces alboflavus]ATM24547.1 hypothetical protein SMD44_p10048 [Streptomyces alboflavus]